MPALHRILVIAAAVPLLVLPAPIAGAAMSQPRTSAHHSVIMRPSWNPHVRCRATRTTLARVLGSRMNKLGGATYRGGQFRPGIPDKESFQPPCRRRGVHTFVQLNRVRLGNCTKINPDGDWTCNLTDPTVPKGRTPDMSQIHVETGQKFRQHSGWSRPPGGTLINIQGFVYWDPGHTTAKWHHYTGWEIHSLTAWRRSKVG